MARIGTGGEVATLSKELSDFLIEFSIGLHKNAIYPAGHPLLENTTADLSARLATLLKERATLSLGVARHQLIIEGVATDEANPVLRELAARLHRHHLGAVKFTHGVSEDELTDMLATVSVDAGRLPRPLGLEGPEVLTQWPHIRLFPLTFAQLQLIEEDPGASEEGDGSMRGGADRGNRSAALWVGLARAALVAEADRFDSDDVESVEPTVVAKAIEEHKRDAAYDQVVVGYMLQIAEELKTRSGRDAAALQRRISQLVGQLSPETLERLMHMSGDRQQRHKFVLDASQGMAVDAVVELVRAAAHSSQQNVSHSMMRMLTKLAAHAEEGSAPIRSQADGALREQVAKLLEDWQLDDPNPDGYRDALEKMAAAAPKAVAQEVAYPIEPERLLAMGLEIETLGEQVWRSVAKLANGPDLGPLLDLVDNAPAEWMRAVLWRHVATATRLREQLLVDPLPQPILDRLVRQMGAAAASPLLDALEGTSDERSQQTLLGLLERVGAEAGPEILERLQAVRWSLLRPLIALLGRHPEWQSGYDAAAWILHPDAAVRREAYRQQLRDPMTRDMAIVAALGDSHEANVRLALGAAMNNCPREAAAVLRNRADDDLLSPDLRALGIRALASARTGDTAVWLVGRVIRTSKLLRRDALAPKSPEMLAAIEGLAVHWRDTREARAALVLARASNDPEITAAAAMTSRPTAAVDTPTSNPAIREEPDP